MITSCSYSWHYHWAYSPAQEGITHCSLITLYVNALSYGLMVISTNEVTVVLVLTTAGSTAGLTLEFKTTVEQCKTNAPLSPSSITWYWPKDRY